MNKEQLTNFGKKYAKAWCSQKPGSVAAFFSTNGSLKVNADPPAVGQEAITKVAQGFMTAFPDMVVSMDSLITKPDGIEFHWTLTGTNTGPEGTGKKVKISGFELWHFDKDGLIQESIGSFDYAFRKYTEAWAFKHPTPYDFFHCMNSAAGEDLNWFWKEWFFTTWKMDQAIADVKYTDNDPSTSSLITIENKGKMILPVIIKIIQANGQTEIIKLPNPEECDIRPDESIRTGNKSSIAIQKPTRQNPFSGH